MDGIVNKIKILYITNYDVMYGANRSLFCMMKLLKEQFNIEPYLLVPGGGEIGDCCEKIGIKVIAEDFRIMCIKGTVKRFRFRRITRREMRKLDHFKIYSHLKLKGYSFDAIHSNSSIFDIGYYLSIKYRIPHFWHVREFGESDYDLFASLSREQLVKEYNGSFMIAISDAIREMLVDKGCDESNIKKIYNGVDIPNVYEKEYHINGVVNFCMVGIVQSGKNQEDVVKACVNLCKSKCLGFRLHIIGAADLEYLKRLNNIINDCDALRDNIVFYGHRDDVQDILMKMDVGIMASTSEAFGRVTVEYMSNYMPVIATCSGANREILGDLGDYFDVHDCKCLARIMEGYIKKEKNCETIGKLMRERAYLFDAAKNAREVYRYYKEVLE